MSEPTDTDRNALVNIAIGACESGDAIHVYEARELADAILSSEWLNAKLTEARNEGYAEGCADTNYDRNANE